MDPHRSALGAAAEADVTSGEATRSGSRDVDAPEAPLPVPEPKPDGILFLQGVGDEVPQQPWDIATRIARALDLQAKTGPAVFRVQSSVPLTYGADGSTEAKAAAILRVDDAGERVVAELLSVPYRDALFRRLETCGPVAQVAFLAWHSLLFLGRWFGGLSRNGWVGGSFGWRKRLQLLIGALALLTGWLAVLLFVAAGVSVPVVSLIEVGAPPEHAAAAPPETTHAAPGAAASADVRESPEEDDVWRAMRSEVREHLSPILHAYVYPLLGLLAALLAISKADLKAKIRTSALQLAAIHDYLAPDGYKRCEVVSELEGAVEAAVESGRYGRLVLVGYSLGAVVALDATHMHAEMPRRIQEWVKTVVTIACPFDAIATYWPEYFERNTLHRIEGMPWHNVYAPRDVLGSDFRLVDACSRDFPTNTAYPAVPTRPFDSVSLGGLVAHSRYWTTDNPNHPAVWRPVAAAIYGAEHWALR